MILSQFIFCFLIRSVFKRFSVYKNRSGFPYFQGFSSNFSTLAFCCKVLKYYRITHLISQLKTCNTENLQRLIVEFFNFLLFKSSKLLRPLIKIYLLIDQLWQLVGQLVYWLSGDNNLVHLLRRGTALKRKKVSKYFLQDPLKTTLLLPSSLKTHGISKAKFFHRYCPAAMNFNINCVIKCFLKNVKCRCLPRISCPKYQT